MNYESEFIEAEIEACSRPNIREMINLSSFIAFHARRSPDRPALKYRGEEISYAAFDARIRKVASWLAAQGVGAGDVVAVLMKNSAAFLELAFATSHLGAVFLPINFRLSREEVGYIVGNAGARLLVVDEELAGNAAGTRVVVLDEAAQQSVTHLAGDAPPAPMHRRAPSDLMRTRPSRSASMPARAFSSSVRSTTWARSTCPASPCCGMAASSTSSAASSRRPHSRRSPRTSSTPPGSRRS
jgi:fatty-acyl-CoA synthase